MQEQLATLQSNFEVAQQQRLAAEEARAAEMASAALTTMARSQPAASGGRAAPAAPPTPAPARTAAPAATPAPHFGYPPGLQPPRPTVDPHAPAQPQPSEEQMESVRLNAMSIAQDAAAPPQDREVARAWLAEEAASWFDHEDSENYDRWASLHGVVDPTATHEVANTAVFSNATFVGYELPVPYWEDNPFGRDRNLRGKTNHYHPKRGSDQMCGALLEGLQAKGYNANAYEGRTLVSTLSYMHDSLNFFKEKATEALHLSDAQDYKAASSTAIDALLVLAKQHDSITQHLMERLAVLRRLEAGDTAQLALLNTMYDNEHRAGGMSMGRTEARLDIGIQAGLTRNLLAASARNLAAQAAPPARTRTQQQTASQAAGTPPVSREFADALGRHQTRQDRRRQQQQQQQPPPRARAQPQQHQQQPQQQQQQQQQRAPSPPAGAGRGRGGGRSGGGGRGGRGSSEPSGAARAAPPAASD